MTKRSLFVALTLASPLGSAVFEKSRLDRYFASSFLTIRHLRNLLELKVPGSVKVPLLEVRMAPRAYWKGSLKLSLVTCPIALYPASTQAEKTHFHQINTKTGHRLKQQMIDERTGRVVDKDHKGRGYELSKGRYIQIEEEELDAVKLESTHTIEI